LGGLGALGRVDGGQQPTDMASVNALLRRSSQQGRYRRALVDEESYVALRLGQCQRQAQRGQRGRDVAPRLMSDGLKNQDFEQASGPLPLLRRLSKVLQKSGGVVEGIIGALGRVRGQEHPGEGDVLELAQVAEVVPSRETSLTRPAEGFIPTAEGDPHPRPQRRDRPDVGGEVTRVVPLGLVEQIQGAAQVPLSLPDSRQRDAPAVLVLWKAGGHT